MKRNDDEATNLENLKIHRHRNASIMYAGPRLDDLDKKPSLASIVRRWYVLQSKREKQRNANSFVWEQSGFDHRLGMFSSRAHGRLESFHLKMQHLAVSREEVFFWEPKKIPGNSKSSLLAMMNILSASVCLLLRKTLRQYWFDKIFDFVWSSKRFHLHKPDECFKSRNLLMLVRVLEESLV